MAGETQITITGNLTEDPELKFTASGAGVVNFRVASTPKVWNKDTGSFADGETLFLAVSAWRGLAENVAESLVRGTRVIVHGRLQQRSYETKDGEKRTVYEVQADDIGPSLLWSSAALTRNQPRNQPARAKDPWAGDTGSDEPPF
jgi:single-strand DNA-binding protein